MPVDGIKQLIQLCNVRKSWFLVNDEGKLRLNVKHKYYFQCQLPKACLELKQCVFIAHLYEGDGTFLDFHSEVVLRDYNLISSLIDKLLHKKYLAEAVSPGSCYPPTNVCFLLLFGKVCSSPT
mgnify:FL=1